MISKNMVSLQNFCTGSIVVFVEWFNVKSFKYACLVRVAIVANFSDR